MIPPCNNTPPKILVPSLLRPGDSKQATNSARPMSEFIHSQQDKLKKRGKPRGQPLSASPPLWLDGNRYAALTMCGRLVTVENPRPENGNKGPWVRLATQEEICRLMAVNRLIPTVIALYKGDSLEKTPTVTRYKAHFHLGTALQAALARSMEIERAITEQVAREETAQAAQQKPKPPVARRKKSQFKPDGSFIIFHPATKQDGLPPYAIKIPGCPVPEAFEDCRKADRYIAKRRNHIHLPPGCQTARVMARAKVQPVFRKVLTSLPRDPEKLLEMIRREPRIVLPELHMEWQPRFAQGEDGEWDPQPFRNKGTVRHKVRHNLLVELQETSAETARLIEDLEIREIVEPKRSTPQAIRCRKSAAKMRKSSWIYPEIADEVEQLADDLNEQDRLKKIAGETSAVINGAKKVADKAQRSLPQDWNVDMNLNALETSKDWQELSQRSQTASKVDDGHWIRAPIEVRGLNGSRPQGRLVELRIDDLVGLLEQFGMEIEFWLIKDSTDAAPRWALPVRLEQLGSI